MVDQRIQTCSRACDMELATSRWIHSGLRSLSDPRSNCDHGSMQLPIGRTVPVQMKSDCQTVLVQFNNQLHRRQTNQEVNHRQRSNLPWLNGTRRQLMLAFSCVTK
eukprot:TRINITY_DN11582_c0_g2_i18.p5 TRINITY_DN11582_c0_g2~~TRINITY_DN11582_c0_g2_i18.p5  ORF type:complete len:106 (-),score=9.00 TRINITY_DN11582_c0_g2_i18:337-654(-)